MKKSVKAILTFLTILALCVTICPTSADAATYKNITKQQAKSIALKNSKFKASKICNYKIKYDRGDNSYELSFWGKRNGTCRKFSYEIDRATGRIMERDIEFPYRKTCSRKKIGKTAAINRVIKLSKFKPRIVKSGTCTYRYKDCEGTYQVKFRKGNYVHEFEILAPNGKLKEMEFKYKPLKKK